MQIQGTNYCSINGGSRCNPSTVIIPTAPAFCISYNNRHTPFSPPHLSSGNNKNGYHCYFFLVIQPENVEAVLHWQNVHSCYVGNSHSSNRWFIYFILSKIIIMWHNLDIIWFHFNYYRTKLVHIHVTKSYALECAVCSTWKKDRRWQCWSKH